MGDQIGQRAPPREERQTPSHSLPPGEVVTGYGLRTPDHQPTTTSHLGSSPQQQQQQQAAFGQAFGLTGGASSRLPTTSLSSPTYNAADSDLSHLSPSSFTRAPNMGPASVTSGSNNQQQPQPTSPSLPASAGLSRLPVSVLTNGVFDNYHNEVTNPFLRPKRKVEKKQKEEAEAKSKVTLIQDEYFVPSRWPKEPYNYGVGGIRNSDTDVGLARVENVKRKDDFVYEDDLEFDLATYDATLDSVEQPTGTRRRAPAKVDTRNFLPSEKFFLLLNDRGFLGKRRIEEEEEEVDEGSNEVGGNRKKKSLEVTTTNPPPEKTVFKVAAKVEHYDTLQSPGPPAIVWHHHHQQHDLAAPHHQEGEDNQSVAAVVRRLPRRRRFRTVKKAEEEGILDKVVRVLK